MPLFAEPRVMETLLRQSIVNGLDGLGLFRSGDNAEEVLYLAGVIGP
jgi:hypothetical protein